MELRDYNGTDRWSRQAIEERYRTHCRELHIPPQHQTDLTPKEHTAGEVHWVYRVMEKVIAGIESHDRACIALGIEFIEEDQHFTFGKILKSNTARALRRADLTEGQIGRLRKRIVQMLVNGNVPHEFKQYAKLLRKIGVGDLWPEIEKVPRTNPYVMRWCQYLWEQRALGSHRLDRGNS